MAYIHILQNENHFLWWLFYSPGWQRKSRSGYFNALCVQALFPGYYHWSPCPKQHAGYNPAAFDLFPPSSLHLGKPSCLFSMFFALAFHVSVDSGVLRVSQSPGQLLIVTWDPQLQEIKIIQRGEISANSFKETHTFLSLVTCCCKSQNWDLKACWVQWLHFNGNIFPELFGCSPPIFFFFLRRKFSHTL